MDNKKLNIAYIGGGSMGWARIFMKDLALEPDLSGEVRLYDIDYEAAKLNEQIGYHIGKDTHTVGIWSYIAVKTLEEALVGADFVVISILPGSFQDMYSDVHLPERLGIYQSVGDTAGPGGIIRALRTIPMYVEFAEAIKKYCPSAWVINYTNPMNLCIATLYHIFPEIKAIGCCHEVFGTQELLTAMIEEETGIRPTRQDIKTTVMGINHFTWITKATYNEEDLYSLFSKYAIKYYDTGYIVGPTPPDDYGFMCYNRVKFDLFNKYGVIAAAGDRHLAEFLPNSIYLKDEATVRRWGFRLTTVDWRIKDQERKIIETKCIAEGKDEIDIVASNEEGTLIIKSLCGLTELTTNVILPNKDNQIENLPETAIVEANALFSKDSVTPLKAGLLPSGLYDLLIPHIENQQEILHAALEYDKNSVYAAFEREPLLQGYKSSDLKELADDMIQNTIDILPNSWR